MDSRISSTNTLLKRSLLFKDSSAFFGLRPAFRSWLFVLLLGVISSVFVERLALPPLTSLSYRLLTLLFALSKWDMRSSSDAIFFLARLDVGVFFLPLLKSILTSNLLFEVVGSSCALLRRPSFLVSFPIQFWRD